MGCLIFFVENLTKLLLSPLSQLSNANIRDCLYFQDLYASAMEGTAGSPKLLTVEEKWQIIFNEVNISSCLEKKANGDKNTDFVITALL